MDEQQYEVAELMDRIEPHLDGYTRAVILLASIRLIAAMLGPADQKTQDDTIDAIPETLRSIMGRMKELMKEHDLDPTMKIARKAHDT